MSTQNKDRQQPLANWQVVDVTFNSTANGDTVVQHSLEPPTPEQVNYVPIRKAQAADVYHDITGTRKAWGNGYIILRSPVANAQVTLLLFVLHDKRTQPF